MLKIILIGVTLSEERPETPPCSGLCSDPNSGQRLSIQALRLLIGAA
jgi:hypothetical protein